MNGVRILVSDDINNTNIVLNGSAIDLFDDEAIMMKMKQTDIRDISVNYGDFTTSFTVPASPRNNRIFKFWADVNNDGQFESVSGIPCRIDLYGFFFKLGTLKINGAEEDDNGKLKQYIIEFSSNFKSLKEAFGDSKISELNYSGSLGESVEFDFTDTVVKNIIETVENGAIEYPLINVTSLMDDFEDWKFISSSDDNGFKKEDLRPALKLRHIYEAIEDSFGVRFYGGFYEPDTILDKLYLWLNKNDYPIQNTALPLNIDLGTISGATSEASLIYNTDYNYFSVKRTTMNTSQLYKFVVKGTVIIDNPSAQYKLFVQRVKTFNDGTINEVATTNQENSGYVASFDEYVSGNKTIQYILKASELEEDEERSFRIVMECRGTLTVTETRIRLARYTVFSVETAKLLTSTTDNIFEPKFNIPLSLPEMTVADLFSSIIKMFNLVVVPETDPLIHSQLGTNRVFKLEYFTKYYGAVNELDITNYNLRKRKINKTQTYKKFEFKHADSSYGTNILFKASQSPVREYGAIQEEFSKGDEGDYKVESKLGIVVWRQLVNVYDVDENYTLDTTWIIADGLDESFEKGVFNKPTIFLSNGVSDIPSGKYLAFTKADNTSIPLTKYTIFSNADTLDAIDYETSIAFSSEYGLSNTLMTNSLYKNNYKSLLSGFYSPYYREFETTAYLPKTLFTKLSLGTQLIIGGMRYNITDINLNLMTGESKFKLNNAIEESDIPELNIPAIPFELTTTSSQFYADSLGGFTETVFNISYPLTATSLKWKVDYTLTAQTYTNARVSLSSVQSNNTNGLLWYDFYEVGGQSVGNHTTTVNNFIPYATYSYDTATSYPNPIQCSARARLNNTMTVTIYAYDANDDLIASDVVVVP